MPDRLAEEAQAAGLLTPAVIESMLRETLCRQHMTTIETGLNEKLRELPPQRLAEVEDFMDFLRTREERRLTQAAARASEPAFASVWDNDEDAAYDRL